MSSSTHQLTCSMRCLAGGHSCTGLSTLVSLEEVSRTSAERKDIAKCLFNAGDSTQRFCIENRIKLGRVSCIVLSSLAPHHVSGLIGVLLCLSDLGTGSVAIVGPVGAAGLLHNMTPFVNKRYPEITVHEVGRDGSTDLVRVSLGLYDIHAVPVCAKGSTAAVGVAAMFVSAAAGFRCGALPVTDSFRTSPSAAESMTWMRSLSCTAVLVVPLTVSPRGLSSALCDQAKDMCVANGVVGVLCKNERTSSIVEIDQPQLSVALHGAMLPAMFPPAMPPVRALLADEKFRDHWSNVRKKLSENKDEYADKSLLNYGPRRFIARGGVVDNIPGAVLTISFSGMEASCLSSTEFCEYLVERDDGTNDSITKSLTGAGMNRLAAKAISQRASISAAEMGSEEMARTPDVVEGDPLGNFSLDIDGIDTTPTRSPINEKSAWECSCGLRSGDAARDSFCPHCAFSPDLYRSGGMCGRDVMCPPDPRDPILTFLGTGCATPSRHRSNSAILLKCSDEDNFDFGELAVQWSLLMDAGEAVCCQLFNHCGCDLDRYYSTLLSIRVIWISHHHADHHAGLVFLLSEIWRANMLCTGNDGYRKYWARRHSASPGQSSSRRVLVIGPTSVITHAEYAVCVAAIEEIVEFVNIGDTSIFKKPNTGMAQWDPPRWAEGPLAYPLQSVPVEHCPHAYGLVLSLKRPHRVPGTSIYFGEEAPIKITFSGDCRPSESLVRAGHRSALLIHEATFDDDMQDDAISKRHSTTAEALDVAKRMQAEHVILTHFSQRYPKFIAHQERSPTEMPYTNAIDFLHVAVPSQLGMLPNAMKQLILSATTASSNRTLIQN